MSRYIIYTDGGARGNPGVAGAGVFITDEDGKVLREVAKPLGHQTNNFAEYSAVTIGFEEMKKIVPKTKRKNTHLEFRMDSELIQRQLSNKYQIKEETLFPLFIKAHNFIVAEFPNVIFTHVRREKNLDADRLSNIAMDQSEIR
ncbi:MAG TPA: ribonuclease HI family protein [Candidatus Paceibacterota bacterium]